jgi:hypothetical protein
VVVASRGCLPDGIRESIQRLNPSTDAEQVLYDQGLEQVHQLADDRRARLLESEAGLPSILWFVLLVGGIVVVGFTYLFGLENDTSHILMVAALGLVISLATPETRNSLNSNSTSSRSMALKKCASSGREAEQLAVGGVQVRE